MNEWTKMKRCSIAGFILAKQRDVFGSFHSVKHQNIYDTIRKIASAFK